MSTLCRILYVDDDKDSRDLARAMLDYSNTGCFFTSAESAEEALLLIETEPFNLYIFDYQLPEISGIELCRHIRQFDAETPIMFFSAMARPAHVTEGIKAGANVYLVKPNDLEKLTKTVRRLLDENSPAFRREPAIKNGVDRIPEKSAIQASPYGKSQPSIWIQESMADSLKTPSKEVSITLNKIKEKRFNQNQIQAGGVRKLRIRPVLAGTAIFAIIILHFVSQFIFFQSENFLSEKTSPRNENEQITENKQVVETETQYEAKNSDVGTTPYIASPTVQPKTKNAPPPNLIKKKEPLESKAERLRRAEKILTGV